MKPKTVIFIGPQGSGKGTQIERLKTHLTHVDPDRLTVDIQSGRKFRTLAAEGTTFAAQHVRRTLDSGALQPLFLSVTLWGKAFLEKIHPDCNLLIDGFPRTIHEAEVLESALALYKSTPLSVVFLDVPEDVVRVRMKERARADDTDASIEERLRWYREETLPVVEYYMKREGTEVCTISGDSSIDEVEQKINAFLKI